MRASEEAWEKFLTFLDENKFYVEDMLAAICINLLNNKAKAYKTKITVGGTDFSVQIEKREIDD